MMEPKNILLVEDDYESMSGLKEHLEEERGYRVTLTAGKDVFERLGCERFDLLLLDVMIHPRGVDADGREVENIQFAGVNWQRTGLEFLKRLRQGVYSGRSATSTPGHVPVVLLSAVANDSAEDEEEVVGLAQKHIEKPYRLSAILGIIDELLEDKP